MLDYLDLPIYDRARIFEFLQGQLKYEAKQDHLKKFKSSLEIIRNLEYQVHNPNFQRFWRYCPFRLKNVLIYEMLNASSYHTKWHWFDGERVGLICVNGPYSQTYHGEFEYLDKRSREVYSVGYP